jgi:hypothetical protein
MHRAVEEVGADRVKCWSVSIVEGGLMTNSTKAL